MLSAGGRGAFFAVFKAILAKLEIGAILARNFFLGFYFFCFPTKIKSF